LERAPGRLHSLKHRRSIQLTVSDRCDQSFRVAEGGVIEAADTHPKCAERRCVPSSQRDARVGRFALIWEIVKVRRVGNSNVVFDSPRAQAHGYAPGTSVLVEELDGGELRDPCFAGFVLAHGIVESQAFIDANKRVALVSMLTFLELNGYRVEAPDPDLAEWMLSFRSGTTPQQLAIRIYLQGIDTEEIVAAVHRRRVLMMPPRKARAASAPDFS
jgi:hypothetical protein